ncbi:MAG: thymidine kinase [Thermoflexales bacterium]|nr:thymidine kinase [Thermoflexales bacterium]MCX7938342.1 thymidine kinase [Thermoflexales bacterium]MDW8291671.1 thymidine kinase [Anaerolineae bacterium]
MEHRRLDSFSTQDGSVEVICGCMFSGKTEELIRRVRRAIIARQKVQVFKPNIDTRYALDEVKSHNGLGIEAVPVASARELFERVEPDTEVVAIDEAQFFDSELPHVVNALADEGRRVICAGLDLDFRGEPFGPMPTLLCIADRVDKLTAICVVSGKPATRTQRIINGQPAHYDDPIILVGASESYEPRARRHHEVPGKPKRVQRAPTNAHA